MKTKMSVCLTVSYALACVQGAAQFDDNKTFYHRTDGGVTVVDPDKNIFGDTEINVRRYDSQDQAYKEEYAPQMAGASLGVAIAAGIVLAFDNWWQGKGKTDTHNPVTAEEQFDLGVMYCGGEGVAKDYAEAAKWFRKAAEQGHADARYLLGFLYDNGVGVANDYAEAAKWYRKAAEQGHADAQSVLGLLYFKGQGVAKDYTEAAKWYRKAAEQGHADAQYFLGSLYYNGQGVAQDEAEAERWFRKAAVQGHTKAIHVLFVQGQD